MTGLAVTLAQAANDSVTLTVAGATIMALCILLVLGLNVFCLLRILRPSNPAERDHAPLDVDPHDLQG